MYVVFLAGGIASGKSSVAAALESLGCIRIDLDAVSREVLEPGSPCIAALAEAFGPEIVDAQTGELDRSLLAARAFATPETRILLEKIEHPFIKRRLYEHLCEIAREDRIVVVEIPLLDRMEDGFDRADEIVYVHAPREIRRERAIARGMSGPDFDARNSAQPTEDYLFSHADTILDNSGSPEELSRAVLAWYRQRTGATA